MRCSQHEPVSVRRSLLCAGDVNPATVQKLTIQADETQKGTNSVQVSISE